MYRKYNLLYIYIYNDRQYIQLQLLYTSIYQILLYMKGQPSHNDGKSERVVSRKNEDGSFYFALNHNEITSIKDKKHKTTT